VRVTLSAYWRPQVGKFVMAMFTHVTVGTNDLTKARSFYDGVWAPLGYKRRNDLGDNGSIWASLLRNFSC
jgi:hypothetical protein